MRGKPDHLDEVRMVTAVKELKALVSGRYPDATFDVSEGDDPDGVYITATVDVDDPDEITDLVIGRMVQFQIDEGLPVYVIPIRPLHRVIEAHRRRMEENALLPSVLD
jgi:hypothetical protein